MGDLTKTNGRHIVTYCAARRHIGSLGQHLARYPDWAIYCIDIGYFVFFGTDCIKIDNLKILGSAPLVGYKTPHKSDLT